MTNEGSRMDNHFYKASIVKQWKLSKLRQQDIVVSLNQRRDGIIILDPETGIIQHANPYLIHLPGYTKEIYR